MEETQEYYSESYESEVEDQMQSSPPKRASSQDRKDQKKAVVPSLAMNRLQGVELNDYRSRSARPDFYNNQLLSTESADMTTKQGHILLHKNLQLKFMGQENEQLREKVENLQKMVKVNKEIMSSLLQQECQNSMS